MFVSFVRPFTRTPIPSCQHPFSTPRSTCPLLVRHVVIMAASISPKDALDKLREGGASTTVYLDVRTQAEFDDGHAPGALNVPVSKGSGVIISSFVDDVKSAVPSDAYLIVGCKSGKRSSIAIDILKKDDEFQGRLSELEGGFDAWRRELKLPVEKN